MAVLEILTYPDERLRTKAAPVEEFDDEIRKLADDMAETMYAAPGIGLAANQVGVLKRVAVIDIEHPEGAPDLIVLINPEITSREGEICWEEGCLSFPDVREDITRAAKIRVEARDRDGKPFALDAEGLLSVALQHEIDHLDGVTMIDRVSFLKQQMINRQIAKLRKSS